MRNNIDEIKDIANRLLTVDEIFTIEDCLYNQENLFFSIISLDSKLGGAGLHNINKGKSGRYDINDRDIFRPIQYIYAYFKMKPEDFDWVTREIIHMCGLHIESLIKRLFNITKYPLGQALTLPIAKLKLENQLYIDLKAMVAPYNNAKHHMEHRKDTHLFDLESAVQYYIITRKLSLQLMSITQLYTSTETWISEDNDLSVMIFE